MNINPLWFSLGPLLLFNFVLLCTVLIFRPIYRSRPHLPDVENRAASPLLNKWMREYWYWVTDPLVKLFIFLRLSPNTLTVMGVFISAFSGFLFWQGRFGLGGWFMIFAATFDMFDGRVARMLGKETKSGAYLDAVMDRVSEGVVFIGLALYFKNHYALWIVLAALMGSYMVSYARAKGEGIGVYYKGGFMQRPERIVYLGVGAIFSPVFAALLNPIFFKWDDFLKLSDYLYLLPLTFVAMMTWITSYGRIKHVMRELDKAE